MVAGVRAWLVGVGRARGGGMGVWLWVVLNVWCEGWVTEALANGQLRKAARIRVQ
jgi:hypothetical protein